MNMQDRIESYDWRVCSGERGVRKPRPVAPVPLRGVGADPLHL